MIDPSPQTTSWRSRRGLIKGVLGLLIFAHCASFNVPSPARTVTRP